MSIVLQSSGGGSVTIAEPATASNFTATLPAATGDVMVSGNMPAVSASIGTTQTITTGVFTKLALNTEIFDTANAFDSTTNYRFTPQVAGYYQINGHVYGVASVSMSALYSAIYKNNALYQYGGIQNITVGVAGQGLTVNSLVYLNGTTDYVELYGLITGTGTCTYTVSGSSLNWFNGVLVRSS